MKIKRIIIMSKIIVSNLYSRIDNEFLHKKNVTKELMEHIKKFIDKHSSSLYKSGPFDRIYITDDDLLKVNKLFSIENKEIKDEIKKIPFIDSKWKAMNNPFAFLMLCIIRHYFFSKEKNELKTALFFLAIHYYAIIHVRLFKFVQKETMEYTINNLSNKHDLKIYGTLLRALEKKLESFHETYENLLKTDDDKKLTEYLMNLNTRIFQWLRGILNEYVSNKNSGKYFNSEEENFDPENFKETSNVSLDLSRIVENITLKIYTNPILYDFCEKSANINNISVSSLFDTLTQIKKNQDPRVKELISYILQIFIIDEKNDTKEIASQKFLNSCLLIYNKSNTVNPAVIRIKDILNEWLTEYNIRYNQTERLTTKINFRKALFIYFVFVIQYYQNK
jgi:hypothetical protein